MQTRRLALYVWALALISAGGLLLHLRIHPPGREAFNWVAALWGVVCVVAVPWMLSRPRSAPWGWALNLLSVVVGTVAMAWYSVVHWKTPLTPWSILLNSTLGDILILWAKVPLAQAALAHHLAAAAPARPPALPEPYLRGLPVPSAGDVVTVAGDPPGRRLALQLLWSAVGLAIVALAVAIGLRDSAAELAALGPVDGPLKVGGQLAGMLAAALLMLQFALSARLPALDRAFGLDRLLQAHRLIGATALILAGLHPALLYGSSIYTLGKLRLELWPELLGAAALTGLGLVVAVSLWPAALRIPYEAWLRLHALTFALVIAVVIHGLRLGSDVGGGWPRVIWLTLLAGYVALFVWVKVLRPRLAVAYRVAALEPVSPDAWCLSLVPGGPHRLRPHLPGQFAFLTLQPGAARAETHPFTISTPPRPDGMLGFTIKRVGDFTAGLASLQPGARAVVQGPFGLFSHLSHPPGDLVLIAGGIGITPFLSMLRHMAATGEGRKLTLIWGNRHESDILLRDELDVLRQRLPGLRVVHVLSEEEDGEGEKGLVELELLKRVLPQDDLLARFYVCGPAPMMQMVRGALRSLGVPRRCIHWERFSL